MKLSSWKTIFLCVLCLFCAATAISSPAQTGCSAAAPCFTSLVSFNGTNGANPYLISLVQGLNGNLYGTTQYGGAHAAGTIFKITPAGTLTNPPLYSFCTKTGCADGYYPYAGLVLATNGNFYGTTSNGGAHGYGTGFKITPTGTLTTLHSFAGADGADPVAGLVQGTDGNFYGTTHSGGAEGLGTVFKMTPAGTLTNPPLYSFCPKWPSCTDGVYPWAG
jgi:uncharacterized repeat protein (TIGR03803 family)